jgi:hypothetical protein
MPCANGKNHSSDPAADEISADQTFRECAELGAEEFHRRFAAARKRVSLL